MTDDTVDWEALKRQYAAEARIQVTRDVAKTIDRMIECNERLIILYNQWRFTAIATLSTLAGLLIGALIF